MVPVTQVLLACVNRHILAESAHQVTALPSLGLFWVLKQWVGRWMRFSSLCDSLDSHSCSGVQTGGLSSCFLFHPGEFLLHW